MSVTAKELAQKLGLSATAVSMALNNKAGVSTETRARIIKAAEEYGYDFTKVPAIAAPSISFFTGPITRSSPTRLFSTNSMTGSKANARKNTLQ